jgi:hypothetical protein
MLAKITTPKCPRFQRNGSSDDEEDVLGSGELTAASRRPIVI